MPRILSANRSNVLVNGTPVEGLQEIKFRTVKPHQSVAAIGSDERIGVVYGTTRIEGLMRVRTVVDVLETALKDKSVFQVFISAEANSEDDAGFEFTLDDCTMSSKSLEVGAGGVGETVYEFSATRER